MNSRPLDITLSESIEAPRTLARYALGALLIGAALGAARLGLSWNSLAWGVCAVLLAAGASLAAVSASPSARRAGVFLPFSFIGLWAVGFGLASIVWAHPSAELLQQTHGLRPESIPLGLAIATVGLLTWAAGYCTMSLRLPGAAIASLRQWSLRRAGGDRPITFTSGRIVGVYVVGLSARLVLLATGRFSYITSDLQGAITESSPVTAVIGHVEFLTTVGLLLLAYASFQSSTPASRRLLAVALMLEIPFGLLSGMRQFILLRLLGVAVTYVLVRRRVPAVASIVLLGVLAFLSPFTDTYRGEVRGSRGTTVDASGAAQLIPALTGSTLGELSPSDVASGPTDFVTSRLRFIDEVAMVGQRTPSEIAFIPPSDTVLEASTVLIPRAMWPGKPVYTLGLQYAREFWGQTDRVVSARSPTYPGEAFYRGGWGGVLVLMALLGALMASINTSLSPRKYPAAIPMFIVVWITLMDVEGSLVLLPAALTQALLITAVAMRWAAGGRRSAAPESSANSMTGEHVARGIQ